MHKVLSFCALVAIFPNGDDRLRTDGLRSASAALSQLSYIPLPNPICKHGPG